VKGAELLALCKDALARAGEPEAEVFARLSRRGCARFAVGELAQHMELDEPSVLVRVARGGRVAETQASALDVTAIAEAIAQAARTAPLVPETERFPGFAGPGEPTPKVARYAESTAGADAEKRAALLGPALERVRAAGLLSAGMLETSASAYAVATTNGCARSHDATVASLRMWALETAGGGGSAGFGAHMHRDLGALDVDSSVERAIKMAALGKDPISIDAGTYDVVFEAPAVAELVEWLSMTTFGAQEIEQGTSAFAGRLGERITGQGIDLEEDPLDASDLGFGPPFDREGTVRRNVRLIEEGVARGVLHDRASAARAGTESTGSASIPVIGMTGPSGTAVHMAAGDAEDAGALIAGMKRGLYVCRLHYVNGFVDTRRAVMTGLTRDGCFLVEDGKIARPVGNLRFTDSFLEGLARCDGRTRERRAVGTWWSETGTTVVPAIRVRAFRFTSGSQKRPSLGG
jgi:predicted Zn-dependent protease